MKSKPIPQQLSFDARLESISDEKAYFAFTIPLKISRALKTRGPVPISARLNDKVSFFVSLAPIGGGRHWLRVNAKAWKSAKIREGDRVHVTITVLDRASIPKDLEEALRGAGLVDDFRAMSVGQQNFLIKSMDEAAKPETRAKRIQIAVRLARQKREKRSLKAV